MKKNFFIITAVVCGMSCTTIIFIYVFHRNKSETKEMYNSYISVFYMILQEG